MTGCEPVCHALARLDAEIWRLTIAIWMCWIVAGLAFSFGLWCYVRLLRRD